VTPPPDAYSMPVSLQHRVPIFFSKNEVQSLIDQWQSAGRIRRCSHVHPEALPEEQSRPLKAPLYMLRCNQDFFRIERPEGSILFYGCPNPCRGYESVWVGRVKQPFKRFGNWWGSQDSKVKIALIALVAFVIAAIRGPDLVKAVTELVKAIRGA